MRRLTVPLVLVMSAVLAAATAANGDQQVKANGGRGPGLKGPATDFLKLPVPRTFDLSHVEPAHFAEALGKDPQRIFEFVRDHVAYEAYAGCLRGPRGTLLAMAGNSVDRAALLASMLEASGQEVRFARGTLSDADAKELVLSMWVERPTALRAIADDELAPELKAARETVLAGVQRDYGLIREHLKNVKRLPDDAANPSLDVLIDEAKSHYWVQWRKDGQWVDLDPSFADAVPGSAYAEPEILDALPDDVFHRVAVRVLVEEYEVLLSGDAVGEPKMREILAYSANAADLSGIDLVLTHQPENWKGPARSVATSLAAAIEDTGRVKPVLIVGNEKPIAGEPFRQKPPTGRGLGGVGGLLGGEGTRKPVALATAEIVELEFVGPDGGKQTVVREIFDVVGQARRIAEANLTADEVRKRTSADGQLDLTRSVYDLFITTGRIEPSHLREATGDPPRREQGAWEVRSLLRRVNVAHVALGDGLLPRLKKPDGQAVVFYPDSPRVHICELTAAGDARRLTLDLRRDRVRSVALHTDGDDAFYAQVFRGVVAGTVERVLGELVVAGLSAEQNEESKWSPVMSTSSLFQRATDERIKTMLLSSGAVLSEEHVTPEGAARLRQALDGGSLAVAPERAVVLRESPRYAWWQIDPRSGHTIAATDEGLHQTSSEDTLVIIDETEPSVTVVSVWSTQSLSVVVYEVLPTRVMSLLNTLPGALQIMHVF